MPDFDLIVRAGSIVADAALGVADIGVVDGVVATVTSSLSGSATAEIDASGRHVLPGVVDPHVHFNEPGRTEWEGIASGSLALAVGGGTTFVDMPLNSTPVTVTAEAVDAKRSAAAGWSWVDFALWGGLVPGHLGDLPAMAERGVTGFKAFMCDSGIPEFPPVDTATLREGMRLAAELDLPVLLHAEDEQIVSQLTREARDAGRVHGVGDYLATRPVRAELAAIEHAIDLAAETGCRVHIVHVSSVAGVRTVLAASDRGVDVSCETCPQYLLLGAQETERMGAHAKCAPPARDDQQPELWRLVADGLVPMVTSDHSPAPPDLKEGRPLLDAWGGIAGCQSLLGLMLEHGHARRGIPLSRIVGALGQAAATRFRLPGKGRIAPGADADLAIVDLDATHELEESDLRYRHRRSAYVGMAHRGRVEWTILRGAVVIRDGQPVGPPRGTFIRPGFGGDDRGSS